MRRAPSTQPTGLSGILSDSESEPDVVCTEHPKVQWSLRDVALKPLYVVGTLMVVAPMFFDFEVAAVSTVAVVLFYFCPTPLDARSQAWRSFAFYCRCVWEVVTMLPMLAIVCSMSVNLFADMFHYAVVPTTVNQQVPVSPRDYVMIVSQMLLCFLTFSPLQSLFVATSTFVADTWSGLRPNARRLKKGSRVWYKAKNTKRGPGVEAEVKATTGSPVSHCTITDVDGKTIEKVSATTLTWRDPGLHDRPLYRYLLQENMLHLRRLAGWGLMPGMFETLVVVNQFASMFVPIAIYVALAKYLPDNSVTSPTNHYEAVSKRIVIADVSYKLFSKGAFLIFAELYNDYPLWERCTCDSLKAQKEKLQQQNRCEHRHTHHGRCRQCDEQRECLHKGKCRRCDDEKKECVHKGECAECNDQCPHLGKRRQCAYRHYAKELVIFTRGAHFVCTVVASYRLSGNSPAAAKMPIYTQVRTSFVYFLEVGMYLQFVNLLEFTYTLTVNMVLEGNLSDTMWQFRHHGLEIVRLKYRQLASYLSNSEGSVSRPLTDLYSDFYLRKEADSRVAAHYTGLLAILLWVAYPVKVESSACWFLYLVLAWRLCILTGNPRKRHFGIAFFEQGHDRRWSAGRAGHYLLCTALLSVPFVVRGRWSAVILLAYRKFLLRFESLRSAYATDVWRRDHEEPTMYLQHETQGSHERSYPIKTISTWESITDLFLYRMCDEKDKWHQTHVLEKSSGGRTQGVQRRGLVAKNVTGKSAGMHVAFMNMMVWPLRLSNAILYAVMCLAVFQAIQARNMGEKAGLGSHAPGDEFSEIANGTCMRRAGRARELTPDDISVKDGDSYGVCGMSWWESPDQTQKLRVNDLLFACGLSYTDVNNSSPHLAWMNDGRNASGPDGLGDWQVHKSKANDPTDETNETFQEISFIELHSPSRNLSIIAVRGSTSSAVDWVEAGSMFGGDLLFSLLKGVIPGLPFYPPSFYMRVMELYTIIIERATGKPEEERYHGAVTKYVLSRQQQMPHTKFVLTGHSIGGSIAQIAACLTNNQVVAFSAPGIEGLYAKYSYRAQRIEVKHIKKYVTSVFAQNDPSALIGRQGGSVNELRCDPSVERSYSDCHSWKNTAVELWRRCPRNGAATLLLGNKGLGKPGQP